MQMSASEAGQYSIINQPYREECKGMSRKLGSSGEETREFAGGTKKIASEGLRECYKCTVASNIAHCVLVACLEKVLRDEEQLVVGGHEARVARVLGCCRVAVRPVGRDGAAAAAEPRLERVEPHAHCFRELSRQLPHVPQWIRLALRAKSTQSIRLERDTA